MTPIEVGIVVPNALTANITVGEFPVVGSQRIISAGGHLDVDFKWTQTGVLWRILPPNAQWELEAVFEQIGRGEERANPIVRVSHVPADPHTYNETIHVGVGNGVDQINPGGIYKVYAKVTLKVNGIVVACGFGELESVHVMES